MRDCRITLKNINYNYSPFFNGKLKFSEKNLHACLKFFK